MGLRAIKVRNRAAAAEKADAKRVTQQAAKESTRRRSICGSEATPLSSNAKPLVQHSHTPHIAEESLQTLSHHDKLKRVDKQESVRLCKTEHGTSPETSVKGTSLFTGALTSRGQVHVEAELERKVTVEPSLKHGNNYSSGNCPRLVHPESNESSHLKSEGTALRRSSLSATSNPRHHRPMRSKAVHADNSLEIIQSQDDTSEMEIYEKPVKKSLRNYDDDDDSDLQSDKVIRKNITSDRPSRERHGRRPSVSSVYQKARKAARRSSIGVSTPSTSGTPDWENKLTGKGDSMTNKDNGPKFVKARRRVSLCDSRKEFPTRDSPELSVFAKPIEFKAKNKSEVKQTQEFRHDRSAVTVSPSSKDSDEAEYYGYEDCEPYQTKHGKFFSLLFLTKQFCKFFLILFF